jgi:5-methylcytosine-specific restriction endonuclease McrA
VTRSRSSDGWPGGSTRAWRKIRAAILARDGRQCQLRIEGICRGRADCVHHTAGRAVTGDDPRHLVAACTPCNLHIGDPNRVGGGRGKAADPPLQTRTTW